jgi:REP element-mobilizing transposase RayT
MNDELPQRKSPRLTGYDYSQNGVYFVTICSYERACLFGEIKHALFVPSPLGLVVQEELEVLATYWPEVEIDCAVVMPNHIHILVAIFADAMQNRNVGNNLTTQPTLGHIVGNYKSGVTRKSRQVNLISSQERIWQGRYHDHVVRDERSLNTIREYVLNNPARWQEDTFYLG